MNRVNNEAAFSALRERMTICEEDLDALHADPDGEVCWALGLLPIWQREETHPQPQP